MLDRRAERYNILAASAFCMLVYEPLYLFDIGFQLSYLAVLSILYFQPRLQAGVEWLAHDLLWVVDAFSQVPGAVFSFRFDFPAMLVAYGML